MTTTAQYNKSTKVNGWVIDKGGRTPELSWRCWRIDNPHDLNNRQKSFATEAEAVEYAKTHD